MNYDFTAELSSDKITLVKFDVDDPKNAAIKTKFKAVGPQWFFDIHTGNTERVINAGDLWSWGCLEDKTAFEQKVREIINKALKGEL